MKGLSRARNMGAHVADSDIVAYIDDDMVADADWLNQLVNEFTNETIMAVTGPMLPLALIDASDAELRLALNNSPWGLNRFQLDRDSKQWFERTNFGGIGDGNVAFKSTAFQHFEGFDERLGRGATISSGEDHYALFKLVNKGYRIAYTPKAIVFHENLAMNRQKRRGMLAETIAYLAFLLWCHPRFSWRVTKFVMEGVFHKKRNWRNQSSVNHESLSFQEISSAAFSGLNMFWRALIGR